MDNFMDKLAQKFGTNDVIRANSEAEAREHQAAKAQIAEYEKLLSEIRRLNLKCVETNEITNQLVSASVERLEEYRVQGAGKDYSEILEEISNTLKEQDEFIHKENVRVYRNVQASVIEELKLQTEALSIQSKGLENKIKSLKPVVIVSLVFNIISILGLAAVILLQLGIF